jgi:general stress protein 26
VAMDREREDKGYPPFVTMIFMDKKQFVFNFLNTRELTVIASVTSEGMPESAVMEFAITEDLTIIFDTANTTRKYHNLKSNARVAFAFGGEEGDTIQYEGIADEVVGQQREQYRDVFLKKNPDAKKWDMLPETVYFKVVPTWIRYTAMGKEPWEINF